MAFACLSLRSLIVILGFLFLWLFFQKGFVEADLDAVAEALLPLCEGHVKVRHIQEW